MTDLARLSFASVDDPDEPGAWKRDLTLDDVGAEEALTDASVAWDVHSAPMWDAPAYLASLLGTGPSVVEDLPPGRIALLMCTACGDPYCGFVAADLVITQDRVLWTGVRFEWPPGMWESAPSGITRWMRRLLGRERPEDLEPWAAETDPVHEDLVFDRVQYEAAVRREIARSTDPGAGSAAPEAPRE
ncbi:hypothetical protein EOG37_00220 [Clavibacter michiganensis subsp. michiganensis]|uniref:hypothetical protein n=1 Tax=Clavibacter michiganensis TaxID=28447 RepID=UPI001C64BE6F|nr:hypothetical protein [Clavibacter michiganensis]MBW8025109.1 hypothetical protein [Clavibacter michiganensis subsp. michiganensis]